MTLNSRSKLDEDSTKLIAMETSAFTIPDITLDLFQMLFESINYKTMQNSQPTLTSH